MPMKRRAILFFLLFLLQMGSVPTLAAEPTVAAQGADKSLSRNASRRPFLAVNEHFKC